MRDLSHINHPDTRKWLRQFFRHRLLPAPRVDLIIRGDPARWVRTQSWEVGPGHVRHSNET
jgi:hypothetical protein